MLEDYAGIRRVVLACGAVDLRKGIDGLTMIIGDKYKQNPFEKGIRYIRPVTGLCFYQCRKPVHSRTQVGVSADDIDRFKADSIIQHAAPP